MLGKVRRLPKHFSLTCARQSVQQRLSYCESQNVFLGEKKESDVMDERILPSPLCVVM